MVWHRSPGMVLWCWLRKPDIACVPSQLPTLECPCNRTTITDFPARRVNKIRATLHPVDHLLVKQMFRLRMQRAVDRHNVTDLNHGLDAIMNGYLKFPFHLHWESVSIVVVKFYIERLHALYNRQPNSTCCNRNPILTGSIPGHKQTLRDTATALEHRNGEHPNCENRIRFHLTRICWLETPVRIDGKGRVTVCVAAFYVLF